MFSLKSTIALALLPVLAQLAVAVPPACLLAAVNTEDAPADLPTVCGPDAPKVKSQIKSLCGANINAAITAFEEVCQGVSTVSSSAASSSSTGSTSATDYAYDPNYASRSVPITGTASASSTGAPYPVVYTSTYYDSVCSCTKTAQISSTGASGGSSGFATGTAAGSAGSTGTGAIIPPVATGSPIVPTVSPSATSPSSPKFTGAASRSGGSFVAAALVAAGLAMAM
ncbi:MAG: hypothetical protein HETSPECPRED_008217 [Heterodermia speciosa]|uniref:Uncharacterized protein n=1 Tax=Heterodermia speciosa TaxID=116794 RepID=A0A8H3FXJ6_9LECA|nr:MAG: hypothetical protein HETSPECPRED_008217 [Heterodermia speciosa]